MLNRIKIKVLIPYVTSDLVLTLKNGSHAELFFISSYLGKLKNSGLGQIGKFFWGGIWGGLLTSTENLENFGNSWGGQGPNWGGTHLPKIFLGGSILSHPRGTAEV